LKLLHYIRWRRLKGRRTTGKYPIEERHIAAVARQLAGFRSVFWFWVSVGAFIVVALALSFLPFLALILIDE